MGLLRILYTVDRCINMAQKVNRMVQSAQDKALEADASHQYQQVKREAAVDKAADDVVHEYGVITLQGGRATADMPQGKVEALAREMGVPVLELMDVIDRRAKVRLHQDRHLGSVDREAARQKSDPPQARRAGDDGLDTEQWMDGF